MSNNINTQTQTVPELCTVSHDSNTNMTYWKLVRMTTGWWKNEGTDSSINECVLMKLRVRSGRVRESLTHCPGLGSGTYTTQNLVTHKRKLILKCGLFLISLRKMYINKAKQTQYFVVKEGMKKGQDWTTNVTGDVKYLNYERFSCITQSFTLLSALKTGKSATTAYLRTCTLSQCTVPIIISISNRLLYGLVTALHAVKTEVMIQSTKLNI
jgi:hypothetical protein